MVAVRVQSVSNQSATTTSIPVTATQGWAAPTVGNLIVAWYGGSNTVTTPTGYTAGPSVVDNDAVYFWWKIAAAGDSAGVTFTQAGSTPGEAGLIEYSGIVSATPMETVGGSATVNGLTSSSTGGTVTQSGTGASGDLFVALANAELWASSAAAPTNPTWTNSFVNFVSIPSISGTNATTASTTFVADFQNATAASASTACSWTNAATERSSLLIAFKLAAGGAAAQIPTLVMARSY